MWYFIIAWSCTEIRRIEPEDVTIDPRSLYETRLVPSGQFQMGSMNHTLDEQPIHTVVLEHSFVMMKTEVTQNLFAAVTLDNPSFFVDCGVQCPVEKVNWIEAAQFANRLSQLENREVCYQFLGRSNVRWEKGTEWLGWRLPTEAEWAWAARGTSERQNRYSGSDDISKVAWYDANSNHSTHPVCTKQVNPLGLCDMSGNVYEWVWDAPGEYPAGTVTNPTGSGQGSHRLARGGAWNRFAKNIQIVVRKEYSYAFQSNDLGFRLVRTSEPTDVR